MRSLAAAGALALAITVTFLVPKRAHALSCAGSMVRLVSPVPGHPTPRNAHVWVELFSISPQRGKPTKITLRKKHGAVVPATREVVGSGMIRVVHLIPKALLAPETTYVVMQHPPKGKPGVIREFTTSKAIDEAAPPITVDGVRYVDALVSDGWNPGKTRSQTYELSFSDSEAPKESTLYGFWFASSEDAVDFSEPPVVYVRRRSAALAVGAPGSACPYDTLTIPKNPKQQYVGIRVFDAAGNQSPAKVFRVRSEK